MENGGPIQGKDPDSFQAEGYGILSGLIFIRLFITIHKISIVAKLLIVSDSQSFLDRIQKSLNTTRNPRFFLSSSVDIEMQIWEELQLWMNQYDFLHVKSHQDRIKKYEELTWNEKLNKRADELASKYLTQEPTQNMVPFLPASKIDVNLDGISITHHFASTLYYLVL